MPVRVPIAPELAALSNAAKARPGYFSVLDELIGKLPNRPLTVEEIRQRLKPNTMLNREGMQFPLKQNEIDYALEPVLGSLANARLFTPGKISPADLRNRVRNTRPEFNSVPTSEGDFSPHDYSQYSTQGPRRLPGDEGYFENLTTSPSFGETVSRHFTPDTLHFTRGSRHLIEPTDENQGTQMRLIDEIQNDRANQANEKFPSFPEGAHTDIDTAEPIGLPDAWHKVGWQTPEDKAKLDALLAETRIRKRVVAHSPDRYTIADMHGNPFVPSTGIGEYPSRAEAWDALNLEWPGHGTDDMHGRAQIYREEPLARKPLDAPFKDPQDYGRLEMKNQLLNAINQGDDFLGITPSSGPASWFPGTGNKETTYDSVYPGELRKIAKQYGAPFSNVPVAINMADPLNLRTLNGTDIHDFLGSTDWDRAEPLYAYRELADELAPHYTPDPAYTSELHLPGGRPTDHLDEVRKHLDLVGRLENDVASGDATIGDHAGAANELQDAMERLYNQVIKQKMLDTGVTATRDIPSMHLTPEVKDRISRIGLPLFTAAGAAALSPELMHSNQSAEPEMQTYSEGGGVSRFAGILGKLGEDVERGARSGDTQWQRMLADKMAERNAINHPSRRGRSETLGDYGAYMDRRAGNLEAQPAPVRLPPPDTPPAPPVDDSSALQGLTAPNAHAGTGHYDDMSTLERFRQYLGLYEGGSVKRYDTGGPAQAGVAPPANNNLSSWQVPMVAPMANPNTEPTWMMQPQQSILDMSQPNNTGMPQTAQPGQAAPAGGGGGAGGVLQSIAKNEIQGGLEGAAMGALNTGTLSGALSGGLSGITGGLAGSTGAAGTGILGSISGGLSAAGSAIGTGLSSAYGALAAMGPVGWVGAAALAAGAIAAASQKKSSALHHYDLKSGSFTQPMKLDGVQLTAQDLNNYFGPAISTFKNTKNATMALANIKPPSTPAEKAMAAHASALFDGTGNPMRQIAKADPSFGTGIWNAGNKDKKAMKEMLAKGQFPTAPKLPSTPEQQRQDEDAMRQVGYNQQQIAAVNSGNNSALAAATKQRQTMETAAAAPREYNPTAAPAAPQVVAGANKNGLLSRIQQQQAARGPG